MDCRCDGVVDWKALRREFPILQKRTYLNTCSLGALSRSARAAIDEFLGSWESEGAAAWYSAWLEEVDALRTRFGRLIGASPDEVAIAPNLSTALASIASCFDYDIRPKVVTSELDFPTVSYQWLLRGNVKVDFIPSDDGVVIHPEAFQRHIDKGTALVATSHVLYTSGYVQELGAVAELAHERGAHLLVDAYQSAGQVPIDVHKDDVDILVSGGLKWLLGGPGVAYVYVRRDLAETLEPSTVGWFGNARQFEFDPRRFEYRAGAQRFEMGTPAMGSIYTGRAGLDIILDIGVEEIRRRTRELSEGLIEMAAEQGFVVKCPPEPEDRSAIVMIERKDADRDVRELRLNNMIVDQRSGRLRISPFFYNLPEEGEAVLEGLRRNGRN